MASLYSDLLYFSCLISWEHYRTALVFQGTEHLYFHHGVHIDIQPLDTVPNGWKFNILMFAMRMAKMLLNIRYLSPYKNGKKDLLSSV